jgi:hypothetical protein
MTTPTNKPGTVRRWLDRLVRRNPKRTVLLEMYDGELRVAEACASDSGWMARWVANDSQWSLLLPGGKVKGTNLVKGWLPHSGWQDERPNASGSATPEGGQ